jgi:hypothetical protein
MKKIKFSKIKEYFKRNKRKYISFVLLVLVFILAFYVSYFTLKPWTFKAITFIAIVGIIIEFTLNFDYYFPSKYIKIKIEDINGKKTISKRIKINQTKNFIEIDKLKNYNYEVENGSSSK